MKFDFVMKKRRRLWKFSKAQVRAIRFDVAQSSEHKHPNIFSKTNLLSMKTNSLQRTINRLKKKKITKLIR